LPDNQAARWQVIIDRLTEAIVSAQRIIDDHGRSDSALRNFIASRKSEDERRLQTAKLLQHDQAPHQPVGRWEVVRRILDSAAGFGTPNHEGQARFWNRPLPEFLQTEMGGEPIIAPPGPGRGRNSNLIKALRGEPPFVPPVFPMPRNRPPISPEYIDLIERWIEDGCPEF
jgi:hypothetical protein